MKLKLLAFLLVANFTTKAQTAMQLSGPDCNGVNHDLYADLDAGKAVLLHFFMPNCGSCVTPAKQIQKMANNILKTYPGMITGYAMPDNNTTDCNVTASWVTSNSLNLYAPFDSGAAQVAHYGGFGMPTIVLLGGKNHRTMFVTQSYSPADTLEMKDSILNLLSGKTGISEQTAQTHLEVYPNPASNQLYIKSGADDNNAIHYTLYDLSGKALTQGFINAMEARNGQSISIENLSTGLYILSVRNSTGEKIIKVKKQ